MLIRFGVANFKSFSSEQVMDLQADERFAEGLDANACLSAAPGEPRILKAAALFGPNASGKTNFLKAMQILQRMVLREPMPDGREAMTALEPFAFVERPFEEPTSFELEVQTAGARYAYFLSVQNGLVSRESLRKKEPLGRWRQVFVRRSVKPLRTEDERKRFLDGTREALYEYRYGGQFPGPKKTWEALTPPDATFLGTASLFAARTLMPLFAWFKNHLVVLDDPASWQAFRVIERLASDPDLRTAAVDVLKSVDPSVSDIAIEKLWVPGGGLLADPFSGRCAVRGEAHEGFQVRLLHQTSGGVWTLPFSEESAGTRRMLHLAVVLIENRKGDVTLFIDEPEASLHPVAVEQIVESLKIVGRRPADRN